MGKSSKKSNVTVAAVPVAVPSVKFGKKCKRDAEVLIEKPSAKKVKQDLEEAIKKQSSAKKSKVSFEAAPKKPETSSSEDSSDSEEEEDELEQELAEVSFEELQKARSNGSHLVRAKRDLEKKLGRANKNRPMEMSSKKPVGRFREVIQAPKKVIRDPRFESLCGALDEDGFRKRYNFLFEVELPSEREKLYKMVKKSTDPKVTEELTQQISWIDKQLKPQSTKKAGGEILAEHKKREREAAKQGKRPFYLKKSELRKQMLVEKYNDLKEKGKLESFIEKRRRKNASKDHRYIPYRRNNTEA